MRWNKLLIVTLALLFICGVSFSQTAYVNTERGVNLRSGAGTDHSIITAIPNFTQVRVLGKEGEWWRVEYIGYTGYVRSVFLTEETDSKNNPTQFTQSAGTQDRNTVQRTYQSGPGYTSSHNWGIGFRVGDPSGLSVKRYLGGNAIEVSIGQTYFWHERYGYRSYFDDWYRSREFGYADYRYIGHTDATHIGIQIHYLFQNNIDRFGDASVSGLYWYYGLGGQLRYHRYSFDYRYRLPGSPVWYNANSGTLSQIDLGVDANIGLEYKFINAPFSVFLDLTLFMEIIDDPFVFWFNPGLGARYNF